MTIEFTHAIRDITRLIHSCRQEFFAIKLEVLVTDLIEQFIIFRSNQRGEQNVAQYKSISLLSSIDRMLDVLETMNHLGMTDPTPLLVATRQLLVFKVKVSDQIERDNNQVTTATRGIEKPLTKPPQKIESKTVQATKETTLVTPLGFVLTPNKKKILEFIRQFPSVRTKEVVDQFSSISDRTVKRSLNDLARAGLIKRLESDTGRAVTYQAE